MKEFYELHQGTCQKTKLGCFLKLKRILVIFFSCFFENHDF